MSLLQEWRDIAYSQKTDKRQLQKFWTDYFMIENMYLMGNQTNYKWLMESKKQLEDGLLQVKELLEVAADE